MGLFLNTKKTKAMAFNQKETSKLATLTGDDIEIVTDFKYLGSYVGSSEKDICIRISLAWQAMDKMKKRT